MLDFPSFASSNARRDAVIDPMHSDLMLNLNGPVLNLNDPMLSGLVLNFNASCSTTLTLNSLTLNRTSNARRLLFFLQSCPEEGNIYVVKKKT